MRIIGAAISGMALLLWPTVAEACADSAHVIAWMDQQWWKSTHESYDAGADTMAIAAGIGRATGRRYSPEVMFMVFRTADGLAARVVAMSGGCFAGAWDVEPALIDVWIARSKAER